jgi:hypothetical protein
MTPLMRTNGRDGVQDRARIRFRAGRSERLWIAAAILSISASGCASLRPSPAPEPQAEPPPPPPVAQCDEAIFERASLDRTSFLELEVSRLRADLSEAEAAMVSLESGMRSPHTRADAVSQLAEARVIVERAAKSVPWRSEEAAEAFAKLDVAALEVEANHPSTAVFFASRARRIADALNEESDRIADSRNTRFIRGRRVNLRAGPATDRAILGVLSHDTPVFAERPVGNWVLVRTLDGQVGWVHGQLLR